MLQIRRGVVSSAVWDLLFVRADKVANKQEFYEADTGFTEIFLGFLLKLQSYPRLLSGIPVTEASFNQSGTITTSFG
jgi:hypothetical protein